MTPLRARRLAAHLRVLHTLGVLAVMAFATAARADAVDDTLAKFLDDKFPQTTAAIAELSAEAPPQAAAILEALGDNRLMIDQADKIVAYKTAAGALLNAKTGETIADSKAAAFSRFSGSELARVRDPIAPWMALRSALLTRTFLKAAALESGIGSPVLALSSAPAAVL